MLIPKAPDGPNLMRPHQARVLALSLTPGQAEMLRAVVERDLSSGWSDKRLSDALHRRGLVTYTASPHSYHRGGGVWKTRTVVTDVKPTAAGVIVLEAWQVLHLPDAYRGRALGEQQRYALRSLAQHNGGRWWPGCGWSFTSASATARLLESLAVKGLAVRGATAAGDVTYTITATGREEARDHWRKLLDVRQAQSARLGRDAAYAAYGTPLNRTGLVTEQEAAR